AAIGAECPLTGVVHAAGVEEVARLADTDRDAMVNAVRGKIFGLVNLEEVTHEYPLNLFVVFSSIAATWGSGGQAAYAAGNAFLDGWARSRRSQGLPGTSVA